MKKDEENITLAEIVNNEEDRKILEEKPVKKNSKYNIGKVISNMAFVRVEPDNESEITYILRKGNIVTINPNVDIPEYYKVSIDSAVGYVPKDAIAFN